MRKDFIFSYIDLGGYSVRDLWVRPHFKDIKDEVMNTGLISPHNFQEMVDKAIGIMESHHCRQITSKPYGGQYGDDPLHFGIKNGDQLAPRHIQSMILYCDFTKFCTLFSESLRQNEWDEELDDIIARNAKFHHISKSLKELVFNFGSNGRSDFCKMNGTVSGPFFSGVSVVLNVSEFSIPFNTPTSTSKTKEIAWRFAGSGGMVITVGNQKGNSKWQPLFNATWISAYVEEDEYFWFGSTDKLSVEDIVIVKTSRAYRRSIGALYLFDAILSVEGMGKVEVTRTDIKILKFVWNSLEPAPFPKKVAMLMIMYSITFTRFVSGKPKYY